MNRNAALKRKCLKLSHFCPKAAGKCAYKLYESRCVMFKGRRKRDKKYTERLLDNL